VPFIHRQTGLIAVASEPPKRVMQFQAPAGSVGICVIWPEFMTIPG
jgi:hypothetical protein